MALFSRRSHLKAVDLAARTEECARVADEIARKGGDDGWRTGKEIAAAIRALPTEGHSQ